MTPLNEDPCFTFRFADDSIIPRFHLEGVEAGQQLSMFRIDPGTGERLACWRCLRVAGAMPFTLAGVLASLTGPVAAGVGVFAVSAFDTDYLLVKEAEFPEVVTALRAAGHLVERTDA